MTPPNPEPQSIRGARGTTVEQARRHDARPVRGRRARRLQASELRFAQRMVERVGPTGVVLELPCGTGRVSPTLAKAGRLIMMDLAPHMLEVARDKAKAWPGATCVEGDVTKIPLADGGVDLAFCMRLFHHFDSDELRLAALKELRRVSRRFVAVTFYNADCWRYRWRRLRGSPARGHYIPLRQMVGLSRAAGLTVVGRWPTVNINEQQCFLQFAVEPGTGGSVA